MRSSFNLDDLLGVRKQEQPKENIALGDLLNTVAKGEDVDFNKLLDFYMPQQAPQDAFSKVLTMFQAAGAANRERPELGLAHAIPIGANAPRLQRESKEQAMKEAYAQLHKMAAEDRKYRAEGIDYKFSPLGELYKFERGKEPRPVGGSGGGVAGSPWAQQQMLQFQMQKAAKDAEREENRLEKQREIGEKFAGDATATALTNQSKLDTLARLEESLPKFYQGLGSEAFNTLAKPFQSKETAQAFETFKSDASNLALEIAQNQKGAQSDSDMKLIRATKPEVSNTPAGNQSIIRALEATYMRENEFAEAAKEWVTQGGNPNDFKIAWVKYARANPLLQKDKDGNLEINQNNLTNWREALFQDNANNILNVGEPVQGATAPAKAGIPNSPERAADLQRQIADKRKRLQELKAKGK